MRVSADVGVEVIILLVMWCVERKKAFLTQTWNKPCGSNHSPTRKLSPHTVTIWLSPSPLSPSRSFLFK